MLRTPLCSSASFAVNHHRCFGSLFIVHCCYSSASPRRILFKRFETAGSMPAVRDKAGEVPDPPERAVNCVGLGTLPTFPEPYFPLSPVHPFT